MNADQPKDPLARIAELEAELARVKYERDMYKGPAYELFLQQNPFEPFTAEDAERLMNEPQGESLISILEDYEHRYRDRL